MKRHSIPSWLANLALPMYAPPDEGGAGGGGGGSGGAGGEGGGDKGGGGQSFLGGDGDKGGAGGGTGDGGTGGDKSGGLSENWREQLAGDDAEFLAELKRTKTPGDLAKRFKDMRGKLAKGSLDDDPAPPKDKPDELKAWREKHGIPLEATGYTIGDDIKKSLTDADKPIVDGFLSYMHERNASQAEIDRALGFYTGLEAASREDMALADRDAGKKLEETLRADWGVDYRANNELVRRTAREFADGVDWFEARLPDGRLLGTVPEVVHAMLNYAIAKNGDGAYDGTESGKATDSEIESLRAEMNKDIKAWRANPAKRKRLEELVALKEKRSGKSEA